MVNIRPLDLKLGRIDFDIINFEQLDVMRCVSKLI